MTLLVLALAKINSRSKCSSDNFSTWLGVSGLVRRNFPRSDEHMTRATPHFWEPNVYQRIYDVEPRLIKK